MAKSFMTVKVHIDDIDMKPFIKKQPKLAAAATNQTGQSAMAWGRKAVTRRYNVVFSMVSKATQLIKAFNAGQYAYIHARGAKLPFKAFKPRPSEAPTKGGRRVRRPITVEIVRGERKAVQRGFIVNKWGGNVFAREGKQREPFEKKFSMAIPHMLWKFRDEISKLWLAKFKVEFKRRLEQSQARDIKVRRAPDA